MGTVEQRGYRDGYDNEPLDAGELLRVMEEDVGFGGTDVRHYLRAYVEGSSRRLKDEREGVTNARRMEGRVPWANDG